MWLLRKRWGTEEAKTKDIHGLLNKFLITVTQYLREIMERETYSCWLTVLGVSVYHGKKQLGNGERDCMEGPRQDITCKDVALMPYFTCYDPPLSIYRLLIICLLELSWRPCPTPRNQVQPSCLPSLSSSASDLCAPALLLLCGLPWQLRLLASSGALP